MFNKMFDEIIEEVYLKEGNRKVKEESLEEYLNDLSKDDVIFYSI